jgi:multiple sugar transport system substrate-binding protein
MNFAISTYSQHPDEAFDAAMCLRSPEHQLQHAINAGEPPTNRTVYDQPEMQKVYPMSKVMLAELQTAVTRPISPVYQNISTIVSTTLSPPAGINPPAAADELRTSIQDAIDGKGILP